MNLKFDYSDDWDGRIYVAEGRFETKTPYYTNRELFPPKVTLLWEKNKYWGISLSWLGYSVRGFLNFNK